MAIIKKSIQQLVSENPASRPLNGSEAVHIDQGGASKGLELNMGVITVTGNYLIPNGIKTVFVNAASATITLPAIAYAGREIKIVKISSAAGNITVQRSGSNLIIPEMASSLLIKEYGGFVNLISATTSYWERDSVGVLSVGAVSDESLMLRMTYDDLPEIPDDPSGVTYLNDNFTDADGWSALRCTLSYSDGKMILTATDSNPEIQRSVTGFISKQVRLKIKKINSAATSSYIIGGIGNSSVLEYDGKTEHIHDYFITSGATGNLGLYPGYDGSAAGDVYEISFIYIGTGEYLPRKDATGNHLIKVVCSVPVPGVSGNGISRDGVCAYEQTVDAVPFPDVFTFSQLIKDSEHTGIAQYFFYTIGSPARLIIFRSGAEANGFGINYYNGATTTNKYIGDIFTGNDLFSITIDIPNETSDVYQNGVLVSTVLLDGIQKPDVASWFFGAQNSTPDYSATGTFDELRIWARALSAEEHYNLFRSKSRGPVTHVYANALNRGTAPVGASTPGYEGEVRVTDTYLYIYTNGAWRRFAVTAW